MKAIQGDTLRRNRVIYSFVITCFNNTLSPQHYNKLFSTREFLSFFNTCCLGSVVHAASLHAFELESHASFLDLALPLFLGVFKGTPVTKFHQVTRFVHFAFETTQGRFDRFTITDRNPNVDRQFAGWSGQSWLRSKSRSANGHKGSN